MIVLQEEWRKKESRLIYECEQLRHQLKNSPKFAQPDVEKLQEQLKDAQEMNVKLKLDFESYKVSQRRSSKTVSTTIKPAFFFSLYLGQVHRTRKFMRRSEKSNRRRTNCRKAVR